jgi:TrmH family RNA methyltransferase
MVADCGYNHHRMERIASRQNPLVRRFRELARGADASGAVLLDGVHLLQEALRSQVPVDLVAMTDDAIARGGQDIADQAERAGARILHVSDPVLAAMSPVRQPSGVVSIGRCQPATLAECLGSRSSDRAPEPPLVLILAGVQDAGNVGAIVRAAEGGGASAIICGESTADPFGWKALRGAMGSTFRMPIAVRQSLDAIVAALRTSRIALMATVPRDGTPLGASELRGPVAIMVGAEGAGLPADAVAAAEARLTIPMRPPVESLNVAIAAALILFEASRQRELH